ncbi:ADP-ribosylglycohydrolase family protein [Micromonospora sp. Llam7]|uniref:ADP-ribosylglycohydrolase family protein n=1 Tax=Micromonospora tarapacensis TaxID=2835305 RepID=UPI001C833FCC|nr:ADP-ribosylglycohydrolase family protein [Micromonospora tarapacensis]MBX7268837.1 ADP-ribosylglycohydrolase family protein [Micromonospora tarapacensis]
MLRARLSWSHRVRGSMVLAACGDALGAPFEGREPADRAEIDDWINQSTQLVRFTDDTASTLVVADHLTRRRGTVNEDELADELAREWARDPERGYGHGAAQLYAELARGVPWRRAAAELFDGQGSFGNGAAMRVAPIGLLPGLALDAVAGRARRTAAVTHQHPQAVDGAAAQAVATALAALSVQDTPLDAEWMVATLCEHVHTAEFRSALRRVPALVAQGAHTTDVAGAVGNGVAAIQAVPAALAAFLRQPDDTPAAVGFAIGLGGDTDTIASMTGALCGARRAEKDLPVMWGLRLEGAARVWTAASALAELAATAAGTRRG